MKRTNTNWKDGEFNLPGGHLEENEYLPEGAARELVEESGIQVKTEDIHLVHVQHRKSDKVYVDFYFRAYKWEGEPRLTEENKSSEILWADLDNLPDNTVDYEKKAIEMIQNHEIYSQFGGKNE